jgi:hypothetical protein
MAAAVLEFGQHVRVGKWYAVQQVAPEGEEKADRLVVVTVYTYYF